ncbi:nuclear transport factor 2 family protein [Pyxidicoccus sp. MSG2]|uniref:nuclear transport factor 2 family protein n=1 Tax=Pyxidicoccus sp. MSG2 TaxID=2996790 RepID=UPI00226F00DE|nr:nuclear transport factor 2 family protein [Pyxidicoccus sp. MSG2]MCY1017124.1 nuclear transport factor 2 family protein [Pyxidicoccus sp. MSG2]
MTTVSLLLLALAAAPVGTSPADPKAAVAAVLDDWHKAAAAADEPRYFGHFTADGVFMGTDATERWTRDEFRAWSKPYFSKGKAWSFKPVKRFISLSADGTVAWFDETLDTPNLGPSRGSGVLVKEGNAWKIAQYNLSVPIPNDLMGEVTKRVAAYEKAQAAKPAPATPAPTTPAPAPKK